MKRLRKGDQVVVLSGRDKGRKGAVLEIHADGMVVVEGINVVKKHQRANPNKNLQGGILEKTMPLHASKVALWSSSDSKASRIGFRKLADGKKVRFFKSSNEQLDV
jgi:large subunit ribosomal protein L24